MLIKYARSTEAAELVSSGNLSVGGIAPPVKSVLSTLKPDENTYVLSTALSYSEHFGPNSNNDYYGYNPHLKYNGLLNAWDNIGKSLDNDRRKGREWSHGYPCFYGGAVYAHHRNSDPQTLGFGDIIFAHANPVMKRVELVLRIFDRVARDRGHGHFLERLDRGERVDTSMGAKVPFDLCSIDTDWEEIRKLMKQFDPKKHKHWGDVVLQAHAKKPIRGVARTRAEYGPYMRRQAGQVLEDGRRVYVYNDIPKFFDESLVIVGADRTAKSMWHLPAKRENNEPVITAALEALTGMKVGEMKKVVGPRPGVRGEVLALCDHQNKKAALATLAHVGVCCTPAEFSAVFIGTPIEFPVKVATLDPTFILRAADVRPELVPVIHSGASSDGLSPVKVADAQLQEQLAALYAGYRYGMLKNATDLFRGTIKISSPGDRFLLPESIVVDWLSPGTDPSQHHMALMSATTSSRDLEKVASAIDTVMRIKKTSMWAALDDVAGLTAYM